jgi:hypothetical protein
MSGRKYSPRRAGKRWLEGAPSYVLDCFDHPAFADRFTIWFDGSQAFHVKRDEARTIGQGPDQYHNTYLTGLGTSENGCTSGALEQEAHQVAAYRYANGKRRVRWLDLPEATRNFVTRFVEQD